MTQKQNSKNVDTNIKVLLNSYYDDDGGDNNDGSDVTRDRLSNYASCKAELVGTTGNDFQPLTIVGKSSILDAAGLLDPPQDMATSYLH